MFSECGTYAPAGLFSIQHLIVSSVSVFCIILGVVYTWNMSKNEYFKLLKIFSIIVTIFEIVKITYKFYYGNFNIGDWVPLWFCSIFIFALWFTWFKKDYIKEMGLSYIAFACIIAGSAYLISPSSSLKSYPVFHFITIHSMIFHSLMVYSGIMALRTKAIKINNKAVRKFIIFCSILMVVALYINVMFGGNLMYLSSPFGVPVRFLEKIYNYNKYLYTFVMYFVQTFLMGYGVLGIYKLVLCIKKRKNKDKTKEMTK